MNAETCDVLIVGGSCGGVAAALAASEEGVSVVLLAESDWIGGQLTSQGVCTPDENAWVETVGATRRYRLFRQAVRDYYRAHYQLTPEAAANPRLNVGGCWVSRLSYEPKVGLAVLREMLRPHEAAGHLRVVYRTRAVACEMDPDGVTLRAVTARRDDGTETRFEAKFFLDATDLGDLLPLCGTEGVDWTVGAEGRDDTGEPDAPPVPRPDWVQPFTFPFALDWSPETAASNVIAPPHDYDELKRVQNYHVVHGAITGLFAGKYPWWEYRRVLAKTNFADPRVPSDLVMINTAGNDYYGGNVLGANAGDAAQQAETLALARRAV